MLAKKIATAAPRRSSAAQRLPPQQRISHVRRFGYMHLRPVCLRIRPEQALKSGPDEDRGKHEGSESNSQRQL